MSYHFKKLTKFFIRKKTVNKIITDALYCNKYICFSVSGGNNYMDLSDMPLDKNQQTMMWQQNQYMDSGIQSGATTNVNT